MLGRLRALTLAVGAMAVALLATTCVLGAVVVWVADPPLMRGCAPRMGIAACVSALAPRVDVER
ncbi:MAG: hypothetical protein OHK0013_20430 [Sandaracinaceae bacterium]